jgi:hypothetical protein
MTSLENRVFAVFGDGTVVYPGNGDDTKLGEERPGKQSGTIAAGGGLGLNRLGPMYAALAGVD